MDKNSEKVLKLFLKDTNKSLSKSEISQSIKLNCFDIAFITKKLSDCQYIMFSGMTGYIITNDGKNYFKMKNKQRINKLFFSFIIPIVVSLICSNWSEIISYIKDFFN